MSSAVPFEKLYRAHFAYVWRTLCRLGCPRAELADATQDVFLVAFRKLSQFENRSTVRTWLFGIAYRTTLARRRRVGKHPIAEPAEVEALSDSAPDQAAVIELDQRRARLESILDSLSLEQRAVFTLHELEGLDGRDIAEVLGIPKGTVYSRLRTAREVFWKAVTRLHARERFDEPAVQGTR
ncbi:MAG: RNA polymerase sigma factor [Polyangiaceae bacterium]|nr:RNA polymerase sigma factor [Polyangiaceae bacterium]